MTNLTEQVQRTADWLAGQRGFIDVLHVDVFDPDVLAGALEKLVAGLSGRRRHRARSSQGARRDRRTHRARGRRGDPGVGRAELAPPALCRHRQSCRRPHRGDADGTLPRGARGDGRRDRGIVVAARSRRAAVRLPPDPVQRVSEPRARCRCIEGRDDSERTRELTAALLERHARSASASTAAAPAIVASPRRSRRPAAPARWSGSPMS